MPTPHFPNEHGDCPSWCVGCQSTPPQRCFFPDCQCASPSLGDCKGERSAPEAEQVKRDRSPAEESKMTVEQVANPSVRWLRGGRLWEGDDLVVGPAFAKAYGTPANGWADEIRVTAHEVAARVTPGGPYTFHGYLVGAREAVAACLRAALAGDTAPPVPFSGRGSWEELLSIRGQLLAAARELGVGE